MRLSGLGKTYEIHYCWRKSSTSCHDFYHVSADQVFSSPSQIQHRPDLHDSDSDHTAGNGRHTKLDFYTPSSRRLEEKSCLLAHTGGRLRTTLSSMSRLHGGGFDFSISISAGNQMWHRKDKQRWRVCSPGRYPEACPTWLRGPRRGWPVREDEAHGGRPMGRN